MNALQFACKYNYTMNKLGYFGQRDAHQKMISYINDPEEELEAEIKEILQEFYCWPYIKLIAEKNSKEVFDKEVMEAYWLGNSLLDNVSKEDLQGLIKKDFVENSLLKKGEAKEKAGSLPDDAKAHHSFHVLHMGFLNPRLKPTMENLDKFLVGWGKVRKVIREGTQFIVDGVKLSEENDSLQLVEEEKKISAGFVWSINKNDYVTIHWKSAVQKIEEEQLELLKKYTLENMKK